MIGSKSSVHTACIIKAEEESFFYYAMADLEQLIQQYGGKFLVDNCKIDDVVLLELHDALHTHFLYKNAKEIK